MRQSVADFYMGDMQAVLATLKWCAENRDLIVKLKQKTPDCAPSSRGCQVTQSAPSTCAQIATILKNSASEASVANSSTMVRHMSLTPTSVQESNVFRCFGLTQKALFHWSRW
jgi:hypothetical protein